MKHEELVDRYYKPLDKIPRNTDYSAKIKWRRKYRGRVQLP